jgi:hypothetical protein
VALDDDAIIGNSGWGIRSTRGMINDQGIVYEENGMVNTLGRMRQSWSMTVLVKGLDGGGKMGAEVSVKGANGTTGGPVVTDQEGIVEFEELVAFSIDNDGVMISQGPFEVTVALQEGDGDITKSLNVTLSSNLEVPVTLDLSNLALSNLYVSKDPATAGDEVEVSVIVTNLGGVDPGEFTVTFYDGTRSFKKRKVEGLAQGASQEVSVRWKTDEVAIGYHDIRAVADASDEVAETDETDNEVSTKVEVKENALVIYAIPILLIIGVAGLGGFKLYNWMLLRRLERRQRKGDEEVEFKELDDEE